MRWPFVHLAGVVLAAMAIATACTAIAVKRSGRDISILTCTSTTRAGHGAYRAVTQPSNAGYDGQFYYAIAQNPWRLHTDDEIDHPSARHLRVLYPAVCWLCSGGDPELLLWVMPAINLLVIGALAGLGAFLALQYGRSPWWGVTLPLVINLLLPLLRDLTDGLSALLLCALLACWLLRKGAEGARVLHGRAQREESKAEGARVLHGRAERDNWRPGVLGLCACGGGAAVPRAEPAGCWRSGTGGPVSPGSPCRRRADDGCPRLDRLGGGHLGRLRHQTVPGCAGQPCGLPLAGLLTRWQQPTGDLPAAPRVKMLNFIGLLHLTILLAIGAWLVFRPGYPCSRVLRLTLLLGIALAVIGGPALYGDLWSFPRIFVQVPLGIWLLGLQTGGRWQLACLLPGFACSFAAFMRYI